jgi:hypothetical protein
MGVDERPLAFFNYCVCFLDLLGQRAALHNQGLLPSVDSEQGRKELIATLLKGTGPIIELRKYAEDMRSKYVQEHPNSPARAQLPHELRASWDEIQNTKVKMQSWSDGIVLYVCLGDESVKCKMNGIFGMLGIAGSICLDFLGMGIPVRGAIEVGWGVEVQDGDISGAAVARAYELDSVVAQYPRIVVGPIALNLIQSRAGTTAAGDDIYSQADQGMAKLCVQMLVKDVDGHCAVHYLGEEFQLYVDGGKRDPLVYTKAYAYIIDQLSEHRRTQDTKLAFRYSQLLQYFDAHRSRAYVPTS